LYGGGGITPDIIVPADTLTTAEQKLFNAFAPKTVIVRTVLLNYSLELKKTVKPDFVVPPTWRDEFYRRLQAQGVSIDRSLYSQAGSEVDRLISNSVARLAFGDSSAKRRMLSDDIQLERAISAARQSSSQRDLLALATQPRGKTAKR
jgi:hypothetical protein